MEEHRYTANLKALKVSDIDLLHDNDALKERAIRLYNDFLYAIRDFVEQYPETRDALIENLSELNYYVFREDEEETLSRFNERFFGEEDE